MRSLVRRLVLAAMLAAGAIVSGSSQNLGVGTGVPNVPVLENHGPPPTACLAGKFDLSLTTGCNLPFYLNGVFP